MNTLSSLLKFIANSIAPIITNQTSKKVLAAPNGSTGKPSFRSLVASDITSGTFSTSRIPSLDADKITSGTFATGRIPDLSADKITSGTLGTSRIPSLSASKISSGTLSVDRIPTLSDDKISNLSADKITSGTLGTSRIPSLAASKITSGTFSADRIPTLSADKVPNALTASDFKFQGSELDNQSMTADYDSFVVNVALSGYKLMGVVGVYFANASNNGTNSSGVVLRGYIFNSSANTITVYARKVVSGNAKILVHVTGLYIKN